MRAEIDKALCREFPNLYKDRDLPAHQSCFAFGFECMDGWFQIIHDLSEKLEAIILAMPEEEHDNFRAAQVKEKFGTLRFYMRSETEEMEEHIREAEALSARTCECCGQPGVLRTTGWNFTLCDRCDRDRPWRKP